MSVSLNNANLQQYYTAAPTNYSANANPYANTTSYANPLAAFGYKPTSSGFADWSSMGLGGIFDDALTLSGMADQAAAYSATQGSVAKQYESQLMSQGFAKAQWQSQERDQLMAMGYNRATIDAVIKAGGIQASGILNGAAVGNNTNTNALTQVLQALGLGGTATTAAPANNTSAVEIAIQQLLNNPDATEADYARVAEQAINAGMTIEQLDQLIAGGAATTATTATTASNDELTQLIQALGLGGTTAAATTNTSNNIVSTLLSALGLGGNTAAATTNTANSGISSILSLLGLGGQTTAPIAKTATYVAAPSYSDEDGGDAAFWAYLEGGSATNTQTQPTNDLSGLSELLQLLS